MAQDRPFLERAGIGYLRRRTERFGEVELDEEVHVLDDGEQRALRAIERAMVGRAALVGALSGLAAALADFYAQPLLTEGGSFWDNRVYWGIVGGVSGLVTAIEILLLYWDALRSVHLLARAAGVPLFAGDPYDDRSPLAAALTRAALELPNPPETNYGVDPYREVSKWRLVVASLLYKAKISLTNLVAKQVVRRLMGRSAFKVYLELVAVPVYAFWNGLVAFRIAREARLRAIGPSAARVYADAIFATHDIAEDERYAAWGAVAGAVMRTYDVHPNLQAMLDELARRFGDAPEGEIEDTAAFLARLKALSDPARDRILAWLAVAAVLDGRITRAERRLLDEAHAAAGRAHPRAATRRLRRCFIRGEPFSYGGRTDVVAALAGR